MRRLLVIAGLLAGVASYASASPVVTQVFRPEVIRAGPVNVLPVQPIDAAAWVWMPGHVQWGEAARATDAWGEPWKAFPDHAFFRFRRDFASDGSPLAFDVSADERFVLLLDGVPVARGPHRGLVAHWYYQSYRVSGLSAGPHRLEAVCWQLGAHAPVAQVSWRGGFVLKAEGTYDAQLTTGRSDWKVAPLANVRMTDRGTSATFGGGSQCEITGTSFLAAEPPAASWRTAAIVRGPIRDTGFGGCANGWKLFPTERPDPIYAPKTPGRVVNVRQDIAKPFVVPAHAERDLWWDLDDYYTAYPELVVSGGEDATIAWGWTEALRDGDGRKGNRGDWFEKDFTQAMTDTFRCDGRTEAFFTTPWWRAGRWCRLRIRTADAPLTVKSVRLAETRYPLAVEGAFLCDDAELNNVWKICRRGMECCAHEMLVDCPFYEQQMYPGDTRIQADILANLTRDTRLTRFALAAFDWDRRPDGFLPMNTPTRGTQESPTYSVLWALAVQDAVYRMRAEDWFRARLPGLRQTLDALAAYEDAQGLLTAQTPGWRFVDHTLLYGCPSVENLFYLMALRGQGVYEDLFGSAHHAACYREKAARLAAAILKRYWKAERGLFANDADGKSFSEHAQCLAILSGAFRPDVCHAALQGLTMLTNGLPSVALIPCSSYFAHYLLKACFACQRADLAFARLAEWRNYLHLDAKTPFETENPECRSDCHAWSATPIAMLAEEVAGIASTAPGFRAVRIAPQLGPLQRLTVSVPHPDGIVSVDLRLDKEGALSGSIALPRGLRGEFVWRGDRRPLQSGQNAVSVPF